MIEESFMLVCLYTGIGSCAIREHGIRNRVFIVVHMGSGSYAWFLRKFFLGYVRKWVQNALCIVRDIAGGTMLIVGRYTPIKSVLTGKDVEAWRSGRSSPHPMLIVLYTISETDVYGSMTACNPVWNVNLTNRF